MLQSQVAAPAPEEERTGWHRFLPDRGCTLWAKCLECPLQDCAYITGAAEAEAFALSNGITLGHLPSSSDENRIPKKRMVLPIAEVQQLFDQGWSAARTAKHLHLSESAVDRLFKSWPSRGRFITDEEIARMKQLYAEGVNIKRIAAETGRSRRSVRIHLGLEERTKSA